MNHQTSLHVLAITLVFPNLSPVKASVGDRLPTYLACLRECNATHCTDPIGLAEFHLNQPVAERLLQWSCVEDCSYQCMWSAQKIYNERGIGTPQFHGKWPFIRVLGMQEPASSVFSAMNGMGHAVMIVVYHKRVPRHAPLRWVWQGTAIIGVNAWFWSTAFHARDVPFTETLDYFCATSLVLWLFFTIFSRVLVWQSSWKTLVIGMLFIWVYVKHVLYMMESFDYRYNMRFNVFCGAMGSSLWLIWCFKVRKKQGYVWRAVVVVLGTNLFLLLELNDFQPLGWVFDAHAIWHGATSIMPYFWYGFGIEDSLHLLWEKTEKQGPLEYITETGTGKQEGLPSGLAAQGRARQRQFRV